MSELLMRILRKNWPFYSHQQLYDMVRTEAAGTSVLSPAEQAWVEFAELMADSRQRIDDLLREAGASWEGVAATSMQAGVTPLAQWADDASTAGRASGSGLRQVGESFGYTAHNMPEPPRTAVNATYANVFSGMIDQDKQDRLAQEAKQRAVELMQRYSTNAHSAVSSLGVFVAPQDVTVRLGPIHTSGSDPARSAGSVIVSGRQQANRPAAEGSSGPDPGGSQEETPAADGELAAERAGEAPDPTTETAGRGSTVPSTSAAAATPVAVPPDAQTTGGFPTSTGIPAGDPSGRPVGRLSGQPETSTRPAPGSSAGPVGGGRQDGGAARAQGARIVARGGAIGPSPTVAPAVAARREEDREHVSPEFLHTYHDEFWDVSPQASPPVIGDDDPAPPQAAAEP